MKLTLAERLNRHIDKSGPDACWPWTGGTKKGYGRFTFEKVHRLPHRVAFALAKGEIPPGISVLHRCDNPPCCNPKHLFLGTQADNMLDMVLKDRHRMGSRPLRHPMAKLSPTDIENIRDSYADDEATVRQLAHQFNITPQHASRIIRRKVHADID